MKPLGSSTRGIDRSSPAGRLGVIGLSALAFLCGAWQFPRAGRGQEAAGGRPPQDLLHSAPFDRLTLNDGTVLLVDPVSPRPLPPFDVAKDLKRKRAYEPPREGNIGRPGEKSKFIDPRDEEKAEELRNTLSVHLVEGEVRDFQVKRSLVQKVEYFEDMLLAEGDRRLAARDFSRAFECYLRVQMREPGWAGLEDRVNRLLFEEGSAALLEGDDERGLRLLRELFLRKPAYPGLADKLAEAYGTRASRAFELGLYAKGRKILHDVEPLAPNHRILRQARDRFIARAKQLVEEATRLAGAARVDALTEALRVWPELEGTAARYNEAFAAVPTLDVAVTDIPRPVGPWLRSPADQRVAPLLYLPILARDDDEALQGRLPGQLAAGLQTTDLGQRLVLQLRKGPSWSDRSRPVSAIDVARALTDRADPASPQYNARWADLLDRVDTPEEGVVEVRLTRIALKPAAWLLAPIGPAHGGWDGRVATLNRGRELVGDAAFAWSSASANQLELRAAEAPSGASAPRVRRLREVRFPSGGAAFGALARGEVSLVEHVPPDRVAELSATPEMKVGRYTRPVLHLIAVDGRNPALRNRTLRRALSYAIDRKTLLSETVLRRPPDGANHAADGPFPRGSYADAPGVEPLGYDPLLAKMLVAAAKKELEVAAVKLTLEYPGLAEAQAVVPKLVEALRLVGVELAAAEVPESELEAGLRSGRTFDLAYRVVRCDEPVIEAGGLISPGYDAPPSAGTLGSVASPRILQLLLQLERAPEWPTAKGVVLQIDRESRDELPVLPLWQLEDHYAWRARLKGPADSCETLYQGIETWEVEPWYAKDPW